VRLAGEKPPTARCQSNNQQCCASDRPPIGLISGPVSTPPRWLRRLRDQNLNRALDAANLYEFPLHSDSAASGLSPAFC
jgi:hypothetical protein